MKLSPIPSRPPDHSNRKVFVWNFFKKSTRFNLSHLSNTWNMEPGIWNMKLSPIPYRPLDHSDQRVFVWNVFLKSRHFSLVTCAERAQQPNTLLPSLLFLLSSSIHHSPLTMIHPPFTQYLNRGSNACFTRENYSNLFLNLGLLAAGRRASIH